MAFYEIQKIGKWKMGVIYEGNRNMKRGEIVEVAGRKGSLNEERVKADGEGSNGQWTMDN
jgi:hypothetical protein